MVKYRLHFFYSVLILILCAVLQYNNNTTYMSTSSITSNPVTPVGKKFKDEYGDNVTIVNATEANEKDTLDHLVDQLTNKKSQFIILEEPAASVSLSTDMLGYYHSKNGGEMKQFSRIWFNQNTDWFKNELVPSGIPYPKEYFCILDIPENPGGMYKLFGSVGGSVQIPGNKRVISRFDKKP